MFDGFERKLKKRLKSGQSLSFALMKIESKMGLTIDAINPSVDNFSEDQKMLGINLINVKNISQNISSRDVYKFPFGEHRIHYYVRNGKGDTFSRFNVNYLGSRI